ncbi:MAG TPA: hypothetical protein PLK30_28225 [Blastocatellia bacterium]|nr:hypothetical protein [Blastocatellia bacterium]
MTKKTYLAMLLIMLLSLLSAGCISVEQEIFLESDGSGDMVMHLSLPDIPEELMKNSPAASAGAMQPDPKQMIEELKQKFSAGLPPTVQLKEAKEVKRNGAFGYYIVLHFKQLSDLESALDSFSKEGLGEQKPGEPQKANNSYWKVAQEKRGNLTVITQRMFIDLADAFDSKSPEANKEKPAEPAAAPIEPAPAPKAPPKQRATKRTGRASASAPEKAEDPPSPPPADMSADFMKGMFEGQMMGMLLSSLFKFRFIVHAPRNFTETNADIVLGGKTAIWNASFGAFMDEKNPKEKKVLEMKVIY